MRAAFLDFDWVSHHAGGPPRMSLRFEWMGERAALPKTFDALWRLARASIGLQRYSSGER